MILIGGHILSYKKFLLLILIILSLLCSIATVSAENSGIADDSRDIPVIDHNTQPSNYIEETGDLSIDDSSSSEGNSNSVSTNQSTPIVSNNSTLASKKAPRVWINKMIIKSKKTVIKLKSDKKGIIYYTTDGKNPTLNSKKFKNNITLSSNKVLKYFILANDGTKSKIFTYKRILGKTTKGYVEKLYYGNLSSTKTIALIVGVHVQENGMHKAMQKSLKNKNGKLNRRFVLYYIHVTKDKNSYSKSRMNGQVLGQKYVVKDISKENPQIVTDIHETNYRLSGYKYPRFIHMISNKKIKSVKISKKLHNKSSTYLKRLLKLAPHIKRFDPQLGSSPAYITVPIANKGIVSYIYETEASYSKNLKQKYADKYIKALNKVNLTFKH
ncbi:chitobiase/beta-hexosaminidase C-terminal domain-containing protein [uncultured Methanobrevibacter sp.]|uniref:chitobiase/beta-hexosaminidase C-terminal domain-containing protein n=1 Tax=Methanobrevibacter sp. TaxID=66852 RepID=UPI0025E98465|nr:chitobiase/beta-hexosaminidase C-terminal domain-containing protein [uncultured Methanobrevibacter sp.]